ncbi:MAG TPA: hypothetical protein VHN18_18860 [Micromonosporaceae bacterium]|nr:hypothetical protein [Micromonosporaceae bacterium]
MSDEIAVVLDATALCAYVDGNVAVGELMAEVADEGRQVAVPVTCLAAAYVARDGDVDGALLALLMTAPLIRPFPLGVAEARAAGRIAALAGRDIALGHAAHTALAAEAHLATTEPASAAAVLPARWSILNLGAG